MPNNFKLTGDYYVSKAGNDANAGTSPDAPKRTVQAAITTITAGGVAKSLIIGSGVYNESLSGNWFFPGGGSWTGDGIVILDGYNARSINISNSSGGTLTITNVIFKNYLSVSFVPVTTFVNCQFINCSYTSPSTCIFNSCRIINCSSFNISAADHRFNNCIVINSNLLGTSPTLGVSVFTNSYCLYSILKCINTITAANFNFNNIQFSSIQMNVASNVTVGVIQDVFGSYYDLSQAGTGGSGSLSEPYKRADTNGRTFDFSNHRIAYPTMNASSSAVDPKFNSVEDQDFTLQAGSPMIGRASNGISNIGGTNYALRRTSKISFSGSQAAVDPSLIFQYDNYIISGSQVTGSITSAPIAVNTSAPKVIQKVTYNGLLAFNKDTGSASGSNQNVPDFDTFTSASGNAAANPDRLVYYMRHTTGSDIPVTDAGWENGGLWTAGQYNVFEWNTKPSIDNNGVGNGSGSFNAAVTPTFIQATYVQMQVKLRNDYLL